MADFTMKWRGQQASAAAKEGGATGIAHSLKALLDASNADVPVDKGELKGSGTVQTDGLTGTVVYTAEHAVFVHEDLEAHHDSGSAKFLENAAQSTDLLNPIAASLRARLKG